MARQKKLFASMQLALVKEKKQPHHHMTCFLLMKVRPGIGRFECHCKYVSLKCMMNAYRLLASFQTTASHRDPQSSECKRHQLCEQNDRFRSCRIAVSGLLGMMHGHRILIKSQ